MKPKLIGEFHDDCMDETYSLYQASLSEIRNIVAKSLSKNGITDMSIFDSEDETWNKYGKDAMTSDIEATYITNGFISLQGDIDNDPWLLDGFTRLFKLKLDVPVFIKVYSKDMSVAKTIKLLLQLNYWKTIGQGGYRNRATTMMLDRGFTLYTFMRSGINLAERRADCPIARTYDTTFTAIIRLYLDELRPNGERDLSSNLGAVVHDRFFDDIILLHKLHDIQIEGKLRYKSESCQLYLPMDFYHVLAKLRTTWIQRGQGNDVINMDVVAFEKWLLSDDFMVKTFHEYYSKVNQNGKDTANENMTQYFVNKYFKPVVLGMEGVLTEIELKEQYRKDVLAFKRQFLNAKK